MRSENMSTRTVAQKLLIKAASHLWISRPDCLQLVEPLPDDVELADSPANATVALMFADSEAALREQLAKHVPGVTRPGIFWIVYPKGNKADINRDSVWPIAGEFGLRPNGQIAVDDYWSALRFRPLKEGEAPFTGGKPASR
jgi:hypothetical protein